MPRHSVQVQHAKELAHNAKIGLNCVLWHELTTGFAFPELSAAMRYRLPYPHINEDAKMAHLLGANEGESVVDCVNRLAAE